MIRERDGEMAFIHSEHIEYRYSVRDDSNHGRPAVDDITLDIEEGAFVAIVGRNGSGKSTFARHINGLLVPYAGVMYVDGRSTSDEDKVLDIRRQVGMVFQNPDNQIIGSVVEEDVAFGPENLGVSSEEIRRRVQQCLEMVDMSDYRKQSPMRLSGGQKQRVSIAGVLALEPRCIVLDEPTAMLDPVGRREVLDILHTLNQTKGVTVILITHYMDEVVGADRVIVVDKGKVALDGTPTEAFKNTEMLRSFGLDVPQVVELGNELREAGIPLADGVLSVEDLIGELCRYA